MTSKVFTPGTTIDSDWLNDVNNAVYNTSGVGSLTTIKSFGAVGDGVANDTAAFMAAEASPNTKIWLNPGSYKVTGTLSKLYYGEGTIILNGAAQASTYANLDVPTPFVQADMTYYEGDIGGKHFHENWTLNSERIGLDQTYFDSRTTPYIDRLRNVTGHSGSTAKIAASFSIGATSVVVNNAGGTELVPGATIVIYGLTAANADSSNRRIITSVAGNTINFAVPLTIKFTYTPGTNPNYVSVGMRTMNPTRWSYLDHQGGGDAYVHGATVNVYGTIKQPGQTHFFRTATGGIVGGQMLGTSDGVYLTGWECLYSDQHYTGGHNIAVIDHVVDFARTRDTGSHGCVWIGTLIKNSSDTPGEPTVAADAVTSVAGPFKSGFNTVMANFGATQAAISMAANQRIIFDSSYTTDSDGFSLWGNVAGTSYITYNSANSAMETWVGGVKILAMNPTSLFALGKFNFGSDANMSVASKMYFNVDTTNDTYLTDTGSYFQIVSKGTPMLLMDATTVYLGNTGKTVQIDQTLNMTNQAFSTTAVDYAPASVMPTKPFTYLIIKMGGTSYKIPLFN